MAIGASAGGVGALEDLIGRLPPDLRVSALVVLHMPVTGVSVLADVLPRASEVSVSRAADGDPWWSVGATSTRPRSSGRHHDAGRGGPAGTRLRASWPRRAA